MARKVNTKLQKKTILLVVEGATEQKYFLQLKNYERLQGINIIPKLPKHSSPTHIMNEAIKNFDDDLYDSVWCVFDRDVCKDNLPKDFESVYQKATKIGIRFAESLPCFEVWFLLHYMIPNRHYETCKDVEIQLCKKIKGYCKESKWLERSQIYKILKEYQPNAIKNAKRVEQNNNDSETFNATFTNVHKLIEYTLGNSSL